MRVSTLSAALALALATAFAAGHAEAAAACNKAAIEKIGEQYRAAYAKRDAKLAPFAAKVKYSENNAAMDFPLGSWSTITEELGPHLIFSDPVTCNVAIHTSIMMTDVPAHMGIRLHISGGKIDEVEHIMSTKRLVSGPPTPFGDLREIDPEMPTVLKPEERVPRAKLIELADGYFKTLSQNDGQIFTKFNSNCHRVENGRETAAGGCENGFKLGGYRFNERVRREWVVVDEERGLIQGRGFIDHKGTLLNYTLTDGTPRNSSFREPHTWSLLETFKVKNGGLGPIIATFIGAPYRVDSPFTNPAKVRGIKER
jgi:hypothetical protein